MGRDDPRDETTDGGAGPLPLVLGALRRFGAALLAGLVAGAVAGLGSRLAMYALRRTNDSHNGEVTHAGSAVGVVTFGGTMTLVIEGMFLGVAGGLLYLVVRPWMPGRGVARGLGFGTFLLVVAGPVIIDGSYEYFRYSSAWVSVLAFAALYPLFGAVLVPIADGLGGPGDGRPSSRAVAVLGYVVLAGALLTAGLADIAQLRNVYHLFG